MLAPILKQVLPQRAFDTLRELNRGRTEAEKRLRGLLDAQLAAFQVGRDTHSFNLALGGNASSHGGELQSLIHYDLAARPLGGLEGGERVLEVGAARQPGVALAFLLAGASQVHVNNVNALQRHLEREYVENLVGLMRVGSRGGADWRRLLVERGEQFELPPEHLVTHAEQGLLDVPDDLAVDLSVSFAVLEHIRDIEPFVRKIHGLTRPGGRSVHLIDMRDHSSFRDPLRYLTLDEETLERTWKRPYQSRRRLSDYVAAFEAAGFEVEQVGCLARMPVNVSGNTDNYRFLVDELFVDLDEVEVWVTDAMRQGFVAPFNDMPLPELSVTLARVVARRAG